MQQLLVCYGGYHFHHHFQFQLHLCHMDGEFHWPVYAEHERKQKHDISVRNTNSKNESNDSRYHETLTTRQAFLGDGVWSFAVVGRFFFVTLLVVSDVDCALTLLGMPGWLNTI